MDFFTVELESVELESEELESEEFESEVLDSEELDSEELEFEELVASPEFISGSDELQASIYQTNSLLFIIIIILSFMFIRTILLSIRGRFYN